MSNLDAAFYRLRDIVTNPLARAVLDALHPALEKVEKYNPRAIITIREFDIETVDISDYNSYSFNTGLYYTVDGEQVSEAKLEEMIEEAEEASGDADEACEEASDEEDEAGDELDEARMGLGTALDELTEADADLEKAKEKTGDAQACLKEAPEDTILLADFIKAEQVEAEAEKTVRARRKTVNEQRDLVDAAVIALDKAKAAHLMRSDKLKKAEDRLEELEDAQRRGSEYREVMWNFVRRYDDKDPDQDAADAAGLGVLEWLDGPLKGKSYLHLNGCGMDLSAHFMQYEAAVYGGIDEAMESKLAGMNNSYYRGTMPDWDKFCSDVGITAAVSASDEAKAALTRDLPDTKDPVKALEALIAFSKEST